MLRKFFETHKELNGFELIREFAVSRNLTYLGLYDGTIMVVDNKYLGMKFPDVKIEYIPQEEFIKWCEEKYLETNLA